MISLWEGSGCNGTTPVACLYSKIYYQACQDILAENILPETPLITSEEYTFKQDFVPMYHHRDAHGGAIYHHHYHKNHRLMPMWPHCH